MKWLPAMLIVFLAVGLYLSPPQQSGPVTTAPVLSAELDTVQLLPAEELTQALVRLYEWIATVHDKAEAAYVLACNLEKSSLAPNKKKALELFAQASIIPALWELSQWHIVGVARQLGDGETVMMTLKLIRTGSPDPDVQARAQFELALYFCHAGDQNKSQVAFASLQKDFPTSPQATEALYYQGEIALRFLHDEAAEASFFTRYLNSGATGKNAEVAIETLSRLSCFTATAEQREKFGRICYAGGNYARALEHWAYVPSDRRWFEEAFCLAACRRSGQSSSKLRCGIVAYPDSASVVPAAELLMRLHKYDRGVLVSFWNAVSVSGSSCADVALWNLALLSGGQEALSYCKRLSVEFPQSRFEPNASNLLFMHAWQQGNKREAVSVAQLSLRAHPHSVFAPKTAFWSGKMCEAMGDRSAAAVCYQQGALASPTDYYSWRSKGRLSAMNGGTDPGWSINTARRHPCPGWVWPDPASLVDPAQVGNYLAPALIELCRLRQVQECLSLCGDSDSVFKMSLLARMNKPLEAINGAAGSLAGLPRRDAAWMIAYPLAYGQAIAREAAAWGVDPLLVHSLIRQESRYMHWARSCSNALGLMQLLPSTAYDVASRIKLPLSGQADILKPDNNIKMGTWYISHVIDQFHGNAGSVMFAVAGYNGGPGAVSRWWAAFQKAGKTDLDIFVEEIPKDETRDYVKRVFENYWNYQEIYGK